MQSHQIGKRLHRQPLPTHKLADGVMFGEAIRRSSLVPRDRVVRPFTVLFHKAASNDRLVQLRMDPRVACCCAVAAEIRVVKF